MNYNEFLHSKVQVHPACGFEMPKEQMNPMMFEWQKDITRWALRKGRAALFEDCGNGKTIQQLEFCRAVCEHTGMMSLIVAPLTVGEQTKREAEKFGYTAALCRTQKDVQPGINITNYQMLDHFDPDSFGGVVLDESSILKNCMGKVRTQIIEIFRNVPYRMSCTATPSPNDYMELGNQVEFLGIMSRTEMLATYFTHDGSDTSKWRLKGHAEDRFWEWVATWAVVLTCPGDLGYPNDGYILPNLVLCHNKKAERKMLMQKPWENSSGLPDPTAYAATKTISDEEQRVSELVKALRYIISLSDFELINRMEFRNRRSGRVYR